MQAQLDALPTLHLSAGFAASGTMKLKNVQRDFHLFACDPFSHAQFRFLFLASPPLLAGATQ